MWFIIVAQSVSEGTRGKNEGLLQPTELLSPFAGARTPLCSLSDESHPACWAQPCRRAASQIPSLLRTVRTGLDL